MYLKKFLHQPNVVGSVLIALLICSGAVFAIGFGGFNVQAVAENGYSGGIEALLRLSESGCCGSSDPCDCLISDDENDSPIGTCDCTDNNSSCNWNTCHTGNSDCDVDEGDCANDCQVYWCSNGTIEAAEKPCKGDCQDD